VLAAQGGATYTLRPAGSPEACTYAGPEERPGLFDVSATRSGYDSSSLRNVRVDRDECHVIPVQLTLELRPR
jgi:hypothetical protein